MKILDLIVMGIKNLWRRKLRTFLTIIGVVIGTAAIVVMLSLGIGMEESTRKMLDNMGSLNVITVTKPYGRYDMQGVDSKKSKDAKLDDNAVTKFKNVRNVSAATPILEEYVTIVSGNFKTNASVVGIDSTVMDKFNYKLESGRLISRKLGENEAIFGRSVIKQFRNPREKRKDTFDEYDMMYMGFNEGKEEKKEDNFKVNVLEDDLKLAFNVPYDLKNLRKIDRRYSYEMKGVGIIEGEHNDKAWSVYMDIEDLKEILDKKKRMDRKLKQGDNDKKKEQEYNRILLSIDNLDDIPAVQEEIKQMGYQARSLTDMLNEMKKQTGMINAVLGGIGAISFLIAAIGITNTMVMSIYERTKEIGIMKVIGAKVSDIRRTFLFEAGVIGITGGTIGLILSYGASALLNHFAGGFLGGGMGMSAEEAKISVIPIWLTISGISFSTFMGVVAGFYPAVRATKISALVAIRNE
ncbi:MAG: ABC transporter permease [Clostridia bacterium]|jgi:ABC-type antimicrobial peptide transport system permease subunit|nr:ABC transporter permease [Clostridia bacterium]